MRRRALLWLTALASVVACARETPDLPPRHAGSHLCGWNRPDSPGCGLGVSRDGRIVSERGYGMADIGASSSD